MVLGGKETFHYLCHIDHHADIGTVGASASLPRDTYGSQQINFRSCSQRRQHGYSMPVVQNHLIGALHKAGSLLLDRLVETFFINLDFQTSREQPGAFMKRYWVAC